MNREVNFCTKMRKGRKKNVQELLAEFTTYVLASPSLSDERERGREIAGE